jgi:hypothetical protein
MNKVIFSLVLIFSLVVLMSNKKHGTELSVKDFVRMTKSKKEKTPPCMQMYYSIEKYSELYNVPKEYAYGIAYKETRYQGPFHWGYNYQQKSGAGAIGPMQIMLGTARNLNDDGVSRDKLMTDIEYNVMTSMKLMRKLYDKYGSWGIALGCYNTGTPCVNGYAREILSGDLNWKNYE